MIDILILAAVAGVAGWAVYLFKRNTDARIHTARIEVHQSYARLMLGESNINDLKNKVLEEQEKAIRGLMDFTNG